MICTYKPLNIYISKPLTNKKKANSILITTVYKLIQVNIYKNKNIFSVFSTRK